MKKSISRWAFAADKPFEDCLKLAKDAGFEGIELSLNEKGGELNLASTQKDVEAVRKKVRDAKLSVASVATGLYWKYSLTSSDDKVAAKAKEVTVKLLKTASWLGTDGVLVIPGMVAADFVPGCEVLSYDVVYDRAREALMELAPQAEKLKVTICVENVWNKFLLSPLEARDFVDSIGSSYVQFYFDVGNVIQTGYPEQWIKILGERIKKIHFKDFKRSVGNINGFVDLLEGDVNWAGVVKALDEAHYTGFLTAEVFPYSQHSDALIYKTSKAMDYILK